MAGLFKEVLGAPESSALFCSVLVFPLSRTVTTGNATFGFQMHLTLERLINKNYRVLASQEL